MTWAMDDVTTRAQQQLEALYQLEDQVKRMRVVETSDDGLITTTVDGDGGLVDLTLSAEALRLGIRELGPAIVETATVAARRVLTDRGAITKTFLEQFSVLSGSVLSGADSPEPDLPTDHKTVEPRS